MSLSKFAIFKHAKTAFTPGVLREIISQLRSLIVI